MSASRFFALLVPALACTADADRDSALSAGAGDPKWFVDHAPEVGVDFAHVRNSETCPTVDSVDGPGVCALDFDGDGMMDLFFPNRSGARSALYRNDAGAFIDVAEQAGVSRPGDAIGCLAFDYDVDGDTDLYVTAIGPDVLFRNDGGTFTDVSGEVGIDESGYSTSATAGDIDGDGDLDLYVARLADLSSCEDRCTNLPINCGRMETNLLFLNEGGRFAEVSAERGLTERDPSLVALFFDGDGDRDPDLFVGNDKGYEYPDRYYENDGSGHFVDRAAALGLDAPGTDTMAIDVGDVDGDGITDLAISDYEGRPTRIYRRSSVSEPFSTQPLPEESSRFITWAVGLVDADLDGDSDLFQTNGEVLHLAGDASQNQLFLNDGTGSFSFARPASGSALAIGGTHRGAAFVDYDDDGDIDVAVGVNGGPAKLLENVGASGAFFRVELGSTEVGAVVVAKTGSLLATRHFVVGGGYLGSSDPRLTFGLGGGHEAEVTVTFRDGRTAVGRVRAGETWRPP